MDNDLILVSICCITYNHEDFIRNAIEGFLMQETGFSVEIIIHDDASTDKTPEIIREYASKYPRLIIPVFQKENQYSKGLKPFQHFVLPMARGKYVALCEGDDYWTDRFKLQKQVDFLEKNIDYSLCVGGYRMLKQETGESSEIILEVPGLYNEGNGFTFRLEDLKKGWLTKTLTALYRSSAIENVNLKMYTYGRDINLFYHLLRGGLKGFYFSEILGVYRRHNRGINSMNSGLINSIAAYNCYKELYDCNKDDHTRYMCLTHTLNLLNLYIYNKNQTNGFWDKLKFYLQAVKMTRKIKEYKKLIYVFFPYELKKRIKEIGRTSVKFRLNNEAI
jgi:glycosyltransferase involved in cell wall biosynthesis